MNARVDPPGYVIEFEQEVLGLLLCGAPFHQISSIIREEHFLEDTHRFIYRHMAICHERYGSINPAVLAKLLPVDEAKTVAARIGISLAQYFANMAANCTSSPGGYEQCAKRIVSQWARVSIAAEAQRIHAASADPLSDPASLITSAGKTFDDVMSDIRRGPKRKTRVSLATAAQNAFAATRAAMERGTGLTGVTWGLTDVNRLTGGMQRRDLTLIAARPSIGKSTIGLSCAIRAAKSGAGVGFISLEMDADKLAARAVTDLAYDWSVKVPYADLIRGQVSESDLASIEAANRDLASIPLIIEDQSGLSMADIRVKIELMMEDAERAGKPIGAMFIDHIGLIRPSSRYQGNRVQEVAEITAGLKTMAREYGIAMVALSQLSRALESRTDKRPQLSDLRDSGAIEQDADTIVFLYREAYYLEREKAMSADAEAERVSKLADCQNKLEFHVAKQRNGRIASIDLFVDLACSAVRNGSRFHG